VEGGVVERCQHRSELKE